MLVSIIIPCYNVEGYVAECLDSALAQTHKQTEIICVDDGSLDDTLSVLEKYAHKHSDKIQIIKQNNSGAPAARNKGLRIAKGEYVQFLDADDLLMPEKISHQINLIEQAISKPDIIAGYCIWKKSNGTEVTHHFTFDPWKDLVSHSLGDTCSNLWNSNSLKKVNGWNEELKSSQEADLLLRLLKSNASVLYDPAANTIVRQMGSGSVSTYNRKANLLRYIDVRVEVLVYLKEINKLSVDIYRAVLKQIFLGARELIHFDETAAVKIFDNYVPVGFPYSRDSGAGIIYKMLYFVFGFKRTELIIFKKLKTIITK